MLLVEDHDDTRELLRLFLEQSGAEVVDVPGGHAALAVLERAAPDILVTDISMPDGDGFSLLRSVRQTASSRLPVVAVTAVGSRERVLAAGFTACLLKPVRPEDLCETVVRALAA